MLLQLRVGRCIRIALVPRTPTGPGLSNSLDSLPLETTTKMPFQRRSRRLPSNAADDGNPLQPHDVAGFHGAARTHARADRKTLQLCRQVADTLNYVLSGDCDDELLQNLQVMSVVPAPNAGQLLVTVCPAVALGTMFDRAEVRQRLIAIVGHLRSEVAASITRRKAPKLLFQVSEWQ